jgi:protein-S-isoprenylcysteine O-methyltransferase Ste14
MFRHRGYLPLVLLPAVGAALAAPAHTVPPGSERSWEAVCMAVSLLGLALRAYTVGTAPAGTSGRNTSRQIAERLNTDGAYSVVRNPLYLGNALMWLGLVLYARNPVLTLVAGVGFVLIYVPIIGAEEAFLRGRFGQDFERWAARTPAFVPHPLRFRPAALPFSFRNVLRREYSGFAALVLLFGVEVVVRHRFATGHWGTHPLWLACEVGTAVLYLSLRTLKRRTRLLHVDGR